MDHATIQGNALKSWSHAQHTQTCTRFDLYLAYVFRVQPGARLLVGFQYLPDCEAARLCIVDDSSFDSRGARNPEHVPSRHGSRYGLPLIHENWCSQNRDHSNGDGQRGRQTHPPWKRGPPSGWSDVRKNWCRAGMTKSSKDPFQPLHLRIRFARPIPQIVVVSCNGFVWCLVFLPIPHHCDSCCGLSFLTLERKAARSCCIPRCKLTRTEPVVIPVRAAISGPVMPSTSRRISVSR